MTPLARGLASLEVTGGHDLVRYRGDRIMVLVGVGLLFMLPAAAVVAFVDHTSLLAPLFLGLCFIGIPVLALMDAQRAGAALKLDGPPTPAMGPELPGKRADSTRHGHASILGVATRMDKVVWGPVSEEEALAYRLDIRAGQDAGLVARHTESVEFLLTCGDGTQVFVSGVLEIVALSYQQIQPASSTELELGGHELLPEWFTKGGWACELGIRQGDTIEVRGPVSQEARVHPLGATYRSAGAIPVLCGTPGNPVVVRLCA